MKYSRGHVLQMLKELADYYEIRETDIYQKEMDDDCVVDDTREYYINKLESFIGITIDKND